METEENIVKYIENPGYRYGDSSSDVLPVFHRKHGRKVITVQVAYTGGEIEVCMTCYEKDDHPDHMYGPVQHGQHLGRCILDMGGMR
jgi:hypothetical protein